MGGRGNAASPRCCTHTDVTGFTLAWRYRDCSDVGSGTSGMPSTRYSPNPPQAAPDLHGTAPHPAPGRRRCFTTPRRCVQIEGVVQPESRKANVKKIAAPSADVQVSCIVLP